jgi:hypothetical protein
MFDLCAGAIFALEVIMLVTVSQTQPVIFARLQEKKLPNNMIAGLRFMPFYFFPPVFSPIFTTPPLFRRDHGSCRDAAWTSAPAGEAELVERYK